MINYLYKYLVAFFFSFIIVILLVNFVLLPFLTNRNKEIYLPDVRGMILSDAKEILSDFNLKIYYTEYIENYMPDEIINSSPRAFTKVKIGRDVKLTLVADKMDIILDNYIDLSYRSTKLKIDRLNLQIDTTIYEYNEVVLRDNIIEQYPKAGKKISDDSKIILIISLGTPPDYYIVPDVINLSLNKGIKKILESGLLIGNKAYEYVDTLLNNTIIQQDQPAYKKLSMPLEINLVISKDK